jgi:hypothetical protein
VVKAFNNIYVSHLGSLQRPTGHPERSVLPVAGDDEAAKRSAAEFLDSIGYDDPAAHLLPLSRRRLIAWPADRQLLWRASSGFDELSYAI